MNETLKNELEILACIKEYRQRKKLSEEQMARLLYTTQSAYSRRENDKGGKLTYSFLKRFCEVSKMRIEDLVYNNKEEKEAGVPALLQFNLPEFKEVKELIMEQQSDIASQSEKLDLIISLFNKFFNTLQAKDTDITYSLTKAAKRMGMSRQTLKKLIKEKKIEADPIGESGRYLISERAILKYLGGE